MSNLPEHIPADAMSALAELNAKERLTVEDMKLMILVECSGEAFYAALAATFDDPECRDLLRRNGREETAHAHRLKKAIEILTGQPFEMPSMAQNPYARPMVPPQCDPGFLELLQRIETDGDAQYQVWAEREPNAEVADLLRQNGREETRHAERLNQVLVRLGAAESA